MLSVDHTVPRKSEGATITSPVIRGIAQTIAYLAVPASLGLPFSQLFRQLPGSDLLPSQAIQAAICSLALFGLVAVFRGARVRHSIVRVGYLFLACYCMLLFAELTNGDILAPVRLGRYDFLRTYDLLLLLPFFAIGLREVGCEAAMFERAMMVTVAVAAGWAVIQFGFLDVGRPEGISHGSPSTFGLVSLTWSLGLYSAALRSRSVEWVRLAFALIGLIAAALSGSKLVWGCAAVGFSVVSVWWAWRWRAWQVLLLATLLAVAIALATAYVFHYRLANFWSELSLFIETGDTSGVSFGSRYSMAVSGLLAFLDRPFFGHGMADVMAAAYAHRPSGLSIFTSWNHLHNDYVTHLVAFGIPGIVFLISLFGALGYFSWRSGDIAMKRFGIGMIGVLALFGMAEDVITVGQKFALIALLLGIISLSEKTDELSGKAQTRPCLAGNWSRQRHR